jgi:hypothetical protein
MWRYKPSDSVEILESSRWTFKTLAPSSEQVLSTRIFAAEDMIVSPMEFKLGVKYISEG